MTNPSQHTLWKEQCEAALDIEQRYGTIKALRYLIGEKLKAHLQLCKDTPEGLLYQEQLPLFIAEILRQFKTETVATYLREMEQMRAIEAEEERLGWEELSEEEREAERAELDLSDHEVFDDAREVLMQHQIKRLFGLSQ